MSDLTFTIIQDNPVLGDLEANTALVKAHWDNNDETSNLIIFSELFICGYPPEDLVLRQDFLRRCKEKIEDLITYSLSKESTIIIGTPWVVDGKTYNAALAISEGQIQHQVLKYELPNYGVFDEIRTFHPAIDIEPFTLKGHKIGLEICEDIWFKKRTDTLVEKGADIIIAINGSPFDNNKQETRAGLIKAHVERIKKPVIFVNQVGGQDDLVFDGASFVIDQNGHEICRLKSFVSDSTTLTYSGSRNAFEACRVEKPRAMEEKIYAALKLGLHDYVTKNGFKGVILGMSGGIDSALSAAIAADALGVDNVRAVMMPSPFTSRESFEDAKSCAEALGISYEEISIVETMKAFENTVPNLNEGIAHENMQSRIRGLTLMTLSNQTGWMVLTTGNKSEMAMGYATLYGDMNGGFNILKDVYKTQVYALSRWRNTIGPVIPERIITKAPTAELRANQTDQDSLPPYDILDDILECLIEKNMGFEGIMKKGHDRALIEKVWTLLDRAEYKRRQAAPGVKITPKAFGKDRRVPITNKFKG